MEGLEGGRTRPHPKPPKDSISCLTETLFQLPHIGSQRNQFYSIHPPFWYDLWYDLWYTTTGKTPEQHESSSCIKPDVSPGDQAIGEFPTLSIYQRRLVLGHQITPNLS